MRNEEHVSEVVGCGKRGVDFFKVTRNAASHGEDVDDFTHVDPPSRGSPELDALGKGKFRHDDVKRPASVEVAAVDDPVLDPRRNAPADNQYEAAVLLKQIVPRHFQGTRERHVVIGHPGNLVEENDGTPLVPDFPVKTREGG